MMRAYEAGCMTAIGIFMLGSAGAYAAGPDALLYRSEIGGSAFSNSTGVITVNQASGIGNAQANQVSLANGGIAEVSGAVLSGVTSSSNGAAETSQLAGKPSRKIAEIGDSAFQGTRGIVQVNQIAGSGNVTINAFSLGVSAVFP